MTDYDNINILSVFRQHDVQVCASSVNQLRLAREAGYTGEMLVDCPVLTFGELLDLQNSNIQLVLDGLSENLESLK